MKKQTLLDKAIKVIQEEGMISFLKKAILYLGYKLKPCILPYAILKVRMSRKIKNIEDLVDFCFYDVGGLIKPLQIREEIVELLKILDKIKPKTVVEIGTANGGILFLFSRIAAEDATIISIDLPGGKFGGGYSTWRIPLYKAFKLPKQRLYLIRADSHSQETLEKVKEILDGRKVDFLFIDGDHTYEGVKKDFEMYSQLVERESNSSARYSVPPICSRMSGRKVLEGDKTEIQDKRNNTFRKSNMGWDWNSFHLDKAKMIALHDIVPGPKENVGGVPEFWREIKGKYNTREIVKDWDQGGYGIGVVIKR